MFAEPNLENLCAFLSIAVKVLIGLAAATTQVLPEPKPGSKKIDSTLKHLIYIY